MVYVRDCGDYVKVFFDGNNSWLKRYYKDKPFTKKEEQQILTLCYECKISVDWGYIAIRKIKKLMNIPV